MGVLLLIGVGLRNGRVGGRIYEEVCWSWDLERGAGYYSSCKSGRAGAMLYYVRSLLPHPCGVGAEHVEKGRPRPVRDGGARCSAIQPNIL